MPSDKTKYDKHLHKATVELFNCFKIGSSTLTCRAAVKNIKGHHKAYRYHANSESRESGYYSACYVQICLVKPQIGCLQKSEDTASTQKELAAHRERSALLEDKVRDFLCCVRLIGYRGVRPPPYA